MLLEKAKIYGVDGVGAKSPTLTRTDDAVGLSYTVGASEITSDFNNCYPWSDIQEVTDPAGNVFIRIPKFYGKVTKNSDGTYKYQISGVRYDGFSTLFIDGKGNEIDYVLVGKYEGSGSSSRVYSKSGQPVLGDIKFADFRYGCSANGKGYQQYDFLIDAIIKHLFLIEFATTNSQSIMRGYNAPNNKRPPISTGNTDSVATPSGSNGSNTDGYHACKYRGIENPWGNTWKWCDGVYFDGNKVYVCTDPTMYSNRGPNAPYFYMGDRCMSNGYSSVITPFEKMPLLGYTTEASGDDATYYSDIYYTSATGNTMLVGGRWNIDAEAGLWACGGNTMDNIDLGPDLAGRLCYKPI